MLIPSISGIGGAYVLSATLENPTTGASLKSGIVRASKKEDVFRALDGLARDIRRTLGESMAAIDRHFPAWNNLGWAYLGQGDLGQAQAALDKAVALGPRSILDWYRIGHVPRLRAEYPAARQAFARVLEIDASESPAHDELGVVARLMKDDATANREFGRFRDATGTQLRAEPKNAEHYLELAASAASWASRRSRAARRASLSHRSQVLVEPQQRCSGA